MNVKKIVKEVRKAKKHIMVMIKEGELSRIKKIIEMYDGEERLIKLGKYIENNWHLVQEELGDDIEIIDCDAFGCHGKTLGIRIYRSDSGYEVHITYDVYGGTSRYGIDFDADEWVPSLIKIYSPEDKLIIEVDEKEVIQHEEGV